MVKGIYITNPIGRTGNHIITALNGIYLCKKYKLRWIIFDNNFKSFNRILDVENKKTYEFNESDEELLINDFRELSVILHSYIIIYR